MFHQVFLESLPSLEQAEIRQIGAIRRWQRGNLVGRFVNRMPHARYIRLLLECNFNFFA